MDEASFSSPQKRYGDYEILKPIGKGKFAVVYRARRVDSEEIVALKRINVDSIDDKAREKCLKEVRLLQSLDHPNVIRYLDSFITENDLVIVFEWAAAGDLKRQLRKAQERGVGFEERVIWKYFSQICDAIQHMHDRRIMHRDLKPANIFLTLDGTVKVGDLGLSRELSEHTVQAHSKVGTPLYMSPEVLRGDGYDFKSDIWSLGCLLYELAQLKSPFKSEGLNLYLLFQKISQGDYQPLPDHYSEELKTLAYAMISTKSEDRPEVAYVCSQARKMRALFNDRNAVLKRQQAQQQQGSAEGTSSSATSSNDNPPAEEKRSSGAGREASTEKGPALANLDVMDSKTSQGGGSDASGQDTPPMRVSQPQHAQRMHAADEEAAPKRASSRSAYNAQPSSPESDDKRNYNYQQQQPYRQGYTASAEQKASKPKAPVATHRAKPGIGSSASAYNAGPAVNSELNLDDADVGGGGGGSDTSALSGSSVAFALMDVVYDRLVLLGYPMEESTSGGGGSSAGGGKKAVPGSSSAVRVHRAPNGRGRLLPVHFACDLSLLGGVAGYDGKIAQYRRLVDVSVWLLSRVGGAAAQLVSRMDAERDAPITIAKQLLGAAQAAGVPQESLSEILPTALTAGYGERVCAFLVALADAALRQSPATTEMRYEADSGLDGGLASAEQGGGMRDDDGEIEDETGDVLGTEEDGAPQETESSLLAGGGDGEGSQSAANHSLLMPAVDPALWREETERVAKQLAGAGAKLQSDTGSTWSEHLVTMQRIVRETYRQESRQVDQGASSSRFPFLAQSLASLNSSLRSELADTRRSEGLVNSRQHIASLGVQFGTHKRDLADLEARAGGRQKALEERTEALAALDEKLADLTEAMEIKTSGDGGSGAGADGGSMALREGIRKLKQDIIDMTLTSALIDANLLQKRAAASSASRSRRTRAARANGKARRGNDAADSMDRAASEWDDF